MTQATAALMREMEERPFAYADVFRHPTPDGAETNTMGAAEGDIPREIAAVWKNESNCTVFLPDGTWLTTWGQGSHEGHPDQRIVFATSTDMGQTWSEPQTIQESDPANEENVAYGIPFVVPKTGRVYVFFFVTINTSGRAWAEGRSIDWRERRHPEHGAGKFYFVYSDDAGETWSERREIPLPRRDVDAMPGYAHGWVNHPPMLMPTGEVVLTYSAGPFSMRNVRRWQVGPAEINIMQSANILTETDPDKLEFTVYPEGPMGVRTNLRAHWDNPALKQLLDFFGGTPEDSGWSLQEMTIVPQDGPRWLGVCRSFLGSPAYATSEDRGKTWTRAEPLRYAPDGEPIAHPHTMCPMARTSDGRYVLLFCNNDGSQRGAQHIWDGNGRTRNPQWFVVGREIPGETRNAGLVFGEPRVLAKVKEEGQLNLKTGISMPQFFEREGRYFACYNINKEHLLLDEIPAKVLDDMTPALPQAK